MYKNLDEHNQSLLKEETERKSDISKATQRKDDIQKQIDSINKFNKEIIKKHANNAEQDMQSEAFLCTSKNFIQTKDEQSKYRKPTFENDARLIDWSTNELNEPREFSVKNVRDIVFSLINQS